MVKSEEGLDELIFEEGDIVPWVRDCVITDKETLRVAAAMALILDGEMVDPDKISVVLTRHGYKFTDEALKEIVRQKCLCSLYDDKIVITLEIPL